MDKAGVLIETPRGTFDALASGRVGGRPVLLLTQVRRPAARPHRRHRFEVLDGVSHWISEEAPERLSALLLEHLAAW